MRSGEEGHGIDQVRYPRSRRWLQFYVDLFIANSPRYCKDIKLMVMSDPGRRNGCNWELSPRTPEGNTDQGYLCLQFIENDLRLLFSIFDLKADEADDGEELRLQRA